jgi:hypothetical protein
MLSFHRVRESVASGMVGFYFLSGEFGLAKLFKENIQPIVLTSLISAGPVQLSVFS